ncbi:MAG: glycerophosphodiester phosphodiesterase [Actinomycetota bacterium]
MQERISPLINTQITFAHRGARAHLPENTIEAFQLALRLGATGLESDTWITRDGIAVLDHDGVVKGRIRNKPINQFVKDDLPQWIPSLAELYQQCGSEMHISLDIKDTKSMAAVISTIAEIGLPSKTWLCHPDLHFLESWVGRVDGCNLVHSTRLKSMVKGPERHAATLRDLGISTVNMPFSDWNGGLVALFHRFGIFGFGWNLQFPEVLVAGMRMGLDGIFSDWPDRATDAMKLVHE